MYDLRQERLDEIHEAEEHVLHLAEAVQETAAPIVQPGFQLPMSIWALMIGCYVLFFAGMIALVAGNGFSLFMLAISIFYLVVFFSTGSILANLAGTPGGSPLDRGEALPTWCGPMKRGSVYGQVLIVPAGIALFGVAVAVIGIATS
jgi:hypothetical protein